MIQKPILILFEENELNIADLYDLYAQKISMERSFWKKISRDEVSHASSIRKANRMNDTITETPFFREVIAYVMNFVLDEIEKTKKSNITHKDALHTALRIERSMIEKRCFDMFTSTNKNVHSIFLKLNNETERHIEILLAEMKKNKFTFKDPKK